MRKSWRLLTLIVTASAGLMFVPMATQNAAAQDNAALRLLSEAELKARFTGNVAEGYYRKRHYNTGEYAYLETYNPDGSLLYTQEGFESGGKWWIKDTRLCHKYESLNADNTSCFYIYEDDGCLYFYSFALRKGGSPVRLDYWNNNAIIRGENSRCGVAVS